MQHPGGSDPGSPDGATGMLRRDWLDALADDVAALRANGQDVVLVSSGAIALGRGALGLKAGVLRLEESQAAAAAGKYGLSGAGVSGDVANANAGGVGSGAGPSPSGLPTGAGPGAAGPGNQAVYGAPGGNPQAPVCTHAHCAGGALPARPGGSNVCAHQVTIAVELHVGPSGGVFSVARRETATSAATVAAGTRGTRTTARADRVRAAAMPAAPLAT